MSFRDHRLGEDAILSLANLDASRKTSSPTRYEGEDFDSFHRNKSKALEYPDSDEEIVDDMYYKLPPLKPCFQTSQPYTKSGIVSPNENDEVDIDCLDEVLNDLSKIGVKNLRRMKQEEVQAVECDEGKLEEIWDIMVEDVERLRQLLTPIVQPLPKPPVVQPYVPHISFPNEVKVSDVMQPFTSQTIYTTPHNDAYVVPNTEPILDVPLEEFRYELLDIIMVDEEAFVTLFHLDSIWRKYARLGLNLGRNSEITTLHEVRCEKGIHWLDTTS
ncbi:hypothetical protein Tco_0020291 [Tanacetum coccineum]